MLSSSLPLSRATIVRLKESDTGTERKTWIDSQREELQQVLDQIDALEKDIQACENNGSVNASLVEAKQAAVTQLEKEANQLLFKVNPPEGLSMIDFHNAIKVFANLPPQARLALIKAVGIEDDVVTDPMMIPTIVSQIYIQRNSLTQQRLIDSLNAARIKPASSIRESNNKGGGISSLFDDKNDTEEEEESDGSDLNFLPRVTRNKDQTPTETDLEILTCALESQLFLTTSKPIQIAGGYLIRGENRKKSGQELIEALDQRLPAEWNCTVVWMTDISDDSGVAWMDESKALVLLNKDFSPFMSDWFYGLTSLVAFGTMLLFSIGVYGANQEVLTRLTDATSLNDASALDWFDGKVVQVLLPILAILASHESGHIIIGRKEKIETTSLIPTFLPILGSLPLLGTITRIKSSPKNLTSLFDFAFAGPLLGFVSSFLFLGLGLVATKAAMEGGDTAQLLPALPVSVINLSTLGGSIIDYFFAGGPGFITNSDPSTPVPLHPLAIAGYCGLLINAAEMLPLGATDGGRLSMAIFGRRGHNVIGGLTWGALLVSTLALEDTQVSILISSWAANNVFQNDMEVPCRDESENPNLIRLCLAFALWFLAALVIIPL